MLNVRSLCLFTCLFVAACSSSPQGTPIDPSDPLADACAGASTVEEVTAIRTVFAAFVQQNQPVASAYSFAFDQCGSTTQPGADFTDCLTCVAAAIDEAYDISSTGTPVDETDPLAADCPGISAEALSALRDLYGEFVDRDMSISDAQLAADQNCEFTPYAGADLATCNTCVDAVINEAYDN